MRKIIVTFLTLLIITITFGKEPDAKVALSPGISYQGQFFGELNLMYYLKCYRTPQGTFIHGPRVGSEFNFKNSFIYAPKFGYEWTLIIFSCRINSLLYVQNRKLDLRILPEIGFNLGYANLMYGYNIPLLRYRNTDITAHRISLTFNIDKVCK